MRYQDNSKVTVNNSKLTLVVFLSGIISIALPVHSEGWAGLSPKGPLPVSIVDAARLFEQCSRRAPQPSGPLWLPSSSEIAALEQDLLTYMEALGEANFADSRWSRSAYRGQYVGFGDGNERYIYGSYTNRDLTDVFVSGKPIIMCDGGPSSWGILYRIEGSVFSDFAVNGR